MKLYTFQRMHVWETLTQLGYYHPFNIFEHDEFLSQDLKDNWGFSQAYIWLREKMIEKEVGYIANNSHLIWAWYHWGGNKKRMPDKRFASVYDYYQDEPYIMLELDVPEDRITLSDYDLWHWVLNYWYADKTRKANQFEKQYDYYRNKPLPFEGDKLLKETWSNVFNLNKSRDILDITKKQQFIQATFFELFYTDITKVHFFKDKKCYLMQKLNHDIKK